MSHVRKCWFQLFFVSDVHQRDHVFWYSPHTIGCRAAQCDTADFQAAQEIRDRQKRATRLRTRFFGWFVWELLRNPQPSFFGVMTQGLKPSCFMGTWGRGKGHFWVDDFEPKNTRLMGYLSALEGVSCSAPHSVMVTTKRRLRHFLNGIPSWKGSQADCFVFLLSGARVSTQSS